MPKELPTVPYLVQHLTYQQSRPDAIGTAEQAIASVYAWARNADEAIEVVRAFCKEQRIEYICTIAVDAPTSNLVRERIVNDPACLIGK